MGRWQASLQRGEPSVGFTNGSCPLPKARLHFFHNSIKALGRKRPRLYKNLTGPKAGGTRDLRSIVQRLRALKLTLKQSAPSYLGQALTEERKFRRRWLTKIGRTRGCLIPKQSRRDW